MSNRVAFKPLVDKNETMLLQVNETADGALVYQNSMVWIERLTVCIIAIQVRFSPPRVMAIHGHTADFQLNIYASVLKGP